MSTTISSATPEVWFLTGSQSLYGEETLRQVAEQSQAIAGRLGADPDLSVRLVWRPVLTDAVAIRRMCLDASGDDNCVGVIAWMHTFSPAKMWIAGLDALLKPLLHLHTQANMALAVGQHRHGLHEPQPGGPRRPGVRVHPDPARRRPHHGGRPRRGPAGASAGRRVGAGGEGAGRPPRVAAGPVRRQHARRRGHGGRQDRGRAALRRLGQHVRRERPCRGRRRGLRRTGRDSRQGVRGAVPGGPANCVPVASATSRCVTRRASSWVCATSLARAGTGRSRPTSRTSADCASCRDSPCSD